MTKVVPVVSLMLFCVHTSVAEVVQTQGWTCMKTLTYVILSRYKEFMSRFMHFLEDFGQKHCTWARSALLHSIYRIFHGIKFANLQLRQKPTHLSRKNSKYAAEENFLATFASP